MKTLWSVVSLALLINALFLAGVLLTLGATHRLNSERWHRVVQIFRPTLAQEKKYLEAAQQRQTEEAALAAERARKSEIAGGAPALGERIEQRQRADEVLDQRIERLQRDKDDLLRQLQMAEERIAKSQADLDTQRQAFAQAVAAQNQKVDDRDLQLAIAMYEQLEPQQVKEIFANLMRNNKADEVVNYLAAMQVRKAAAVLKEFKTLPEIAAATQLLEMLRRRGVSLPQPGAVSPSAAATPPLTGRPA